MSKPFLLLATRAEDAAADAEHAAVLACGGLAGADLVRVRLEQDALGPVDLSRFSGVILGGGPFNSSDPAGSKSAVQQRVEADLARLIDDVVAHDFPFLGACYGVGTLGVHQGALIDRTYAEPIGRVPITLTPEGEADALFSQLPPEFEAFVGHKEAVRTLSPHAVLLASSPACPVQAFRIGEHVYATQFHPELDVEQICLRVDVYKNYGYFPPSEADEVKARCREGGPVPEPARLLRAFVKRYASA